MMLISAGPADAALDPEEADQHKEGSRLPGHLWAEVLSHYTCIVKDPFEHNKTYYFVLRQYD